MPRKSEDQLIAVIEKPTEQVSALVEEVHVLRDAIDEVRGELQWLTRNADQFRPHVIQETRRCEPRGSSSCTSRSVRGTRSSPCGP